MSKHPREYTNEELGIDPSADAKKFFRIILALVILLFIGFAILIGALLYDLNNREEPVPTANTVTAFAAYQEHADSRR